MTAPASQTHDDDILGKAYDRKLMRRLLVYTRPYRGLMYGAFALLGVEGAIQVLGPLLTRRVRSGPTTWIAPSTQRSANAPYMRPRYGRV